MVVNSDPASNVLAGTCSLEIPANLLRLSLFHICPLRVYVNIKQTPLTSGSPNLFEEDLTGSGVTFQCSTSGLI